MKGKRRCANTLKTRLNSDETKLFLKIAKYVAGYCVKVSDAEVLRYLVRSWKKEDNY